MVTRIFLRFTDQSVPDLLMQAPSDKDLLSIAKQFVDIEITSIDNFGNGLINDTFLITCNNNQSLHFILQRINHQVFPRPEWIMGNIQKLTAHFLQGSQCRQQLTLPEILPTNKGQLYFVDKKQQYWRALSFIENSTSFEKITQSAEAEQVGSALAEFHCRTASLSTSELFDTLPGFHITPQYLENYYHSSSAIKNNPDCRFCQQFIEQFKNRVDVLESAKQKGLLIDRVIHGDPKLNNFLFSKTSQKIISFIDLDTVKPGLVHYDIGDCLRSCCQTENPIHFDLDICELILKHYLEQARYFFTRNDFDFLYPAIELLPFELGLRFFTDYLQGNHYFKAIHSEQNLQRACQQFQLVQSIQQQQKQIENLIYRFKNERY